ncbi:MAG: hypothetical protein JNM57_16765 [Cyclobacteriaceae bacterium]|nr:hypothetical protein [Cyclobacteriaceae bacterium]
MFFYFKGYKIGDKPGGHGMHQNNSYTTNTTATVGASESLVEYSTER